MTYIIRSTIAVFILAILAPFASHAQDFQMNERSEKKLAPDARKVYEKGLRHSDVLNYESALESFIEAKEKAPEHGDIRFLVGNVAYQVGRSDLRVGLEALRLNPKSRDKLGEKALELYEKGMKRLDHVDPEGALQYFIEAREQSPEHEDLQRLAEYLNSYLAGKETVAPSILQLRKGEAAYQEIMSMENVSSFQKRLALARFEKLEQRISTHAVRQDRREEIGNKMIAEKNKEKKELMDRMQAVPFSFLQTRFPAQPGRPPRAPADARR